MKGWYFMKMKRKGFVFFLAAVCLACLLSSAPLLPVSAREISEILTEVIDGVEIIWSGTWQHEGMTEGDNKGVNCFDGDYGNKWGSNDVWTKSEAEWVGVKFPEEVEVGGWCVYQESSGNYTNIKQYSIQVQKGTDEWETIYTSDVFEDFWYEDLVKLEESVMVTAWRFYVARDQAAQGNLSPAGECAVELSEIEIYRYQKVEETEAPVTEEPAPTQKPADATKASTQMPAKNTDAPDPETETGSTAWIIVLIAAAAAVIVSVIIVVVKKRKQ